MSEYGLYLVFLIAVTAVVKGADWFVESALWVVRRTGISEVAIGATLVALATTLPETAVSAYASWSGHHELAAGNAIGSCTVNFGLILGLGVLVSGFVHAPRGFSWGALGVTGLVALIGVLSRDGSLGRSDGLVLLALACVAMWLAVRGSGEGAAARRSAAGQADDDGTAARHLVKFVFGILLIAVGSRFLVSTSSELAIRLGLSETAVGLTLIALGTSLPELATAITAGVKSHAQLALGNLVGANALNLTLVLGLAGVLRPVPVAAPVRGFDLPIVALLMGLAALFAAARRGVGRAEGGTLFALYVIYVFLLVG